MRRNCNLDLRLYPYTDSDRHHQLFAGESNGSPAQMNRHQQQEQRREQQQLTIIYNGRVCVCDVTELQARAIIMVASREMEKRFNTATGNNSEPTSPTLQSPVYSSTGLSMTRSLQRFLQKRKHQIQATSPYNVNRCAQSGSWNSLMCRRDITNVNRFVGKG